MKFAIVDGHRQEAQPKLTGTCPACERPVIAKCGEIRVRYWSHPPGRICDKWWKNETEWHRNWKDEFPVSWQEFVQHSESGERHIADVRTDDGWVLEFQYSYLKPGERRARDAFYRPKLIWVVSGLRRKTDVPQFAKAWNEGTPVGAGNSPMRMVSSDGCRLLQEWGGSDAQVFIDFGAEQGLWWLLGKRPNGQVCVVRFSRAEFIEVHRGTTTQKARDFDSLVEEIRQFIASYESHRRARSLIPVPSYPARRRMSRRNFRL
jgi:hypothetical protein